MAWLSVLALARRGSGAGAGAGWAGSCLAVALACTREKYLSRESLPRVSSPTVTPPDDCWQAPRPPGPFWLQAPLHPLHPTRSAHTIAYLLPPRPAATATPAAPPVAALQTQPDPLHAATGPGCLATSTPAQQPRGGPWAQIVLLRGTYLDGMHWPCHSFTRAPLHHLTTTLSTSHEALLGFTSHEARPHAALQRPGSVCILSFDKTQADKSKHPVFNSRRPPIWSSLS